MANSYLSRTPSSTTNRRTYTFSVWAKFCSGNTSSTLLNVGPYDSSKEFRLTRNASGTLEFYDYNGSSYEFRYRTNRLFRDVSAWFHIVCAVDTTNGTSGDRVKIYVNGVQETSFDVSTAPSLNLDTNFNVNNIFYVGSAANGNYTDGYLSHAALVDGQQLAPTVFGETDSTSGIWKFKSPSGVTWGTNGFHLKFENSGALGTDSSGNSNTFTVGGNGRQALDTPSNVHATLNSLIPSTNATFSNGNNTITGSQADNYSQSTISTLGVSAGKWYCEAKYTTANSNANTNVGIATLENFRYDVNNTGASGFANVRFDGQVYVDGTSGSSSYWGSNPVAGDIIMFALDMDNGKFYLGKNGTWQNSGVPTSGSTGTGSITSSRSGTQAINVRYLASVFDFNFGNGYFGTTAITSAGSNGNGSLFEYDVPSGYYALNTKNINTYG